MSEQTTLITVGDDSPDFTVPEHEAIIAMHTGLVITPCAAREFVTPQPQSEPNQDPQPDFSSTLVDDAVLTAGAMLDHLCCAEGMSTTDALRACAEFKDQSGRAVKTELTDSDRALFLLAADILDAQNEMDYWACRVRFVGDMPRFQAQTEV